MESTSTNVTDLDLQRDQLLRVGTADERVSAALAYFNAAASRIPSPTVTNFAPVQYSTTGNAR